MRSVVDAVLAHAAVRAGAPCFHFIPAHGAEVTRSWLDVAHGMARAAAGLAALGVRRGDVVVLIGTHHPDFYAVWLGAVWCGAVPTVLAEPSVRVSREVYLDRLRAVLERVQARTVATDPTLEVPAALLPETAVVSYTSLATSVAAPSARVEPTEGDLLLLQHSSGTTGLHKGVMLTHGAVAAHATSYRAVTELGEGDVVASWLPLYHDMGLIAAFVGPLLAGAAVAWLSPFAWIASPQLLLDAVEKHRATHCWLPNFSLLVLARRCRRRASLASLRHVVNCSEVVTADAMRTFAERFTPDGLDPKALATCYAMAENVYAMTSTTRDDPPRTRAVDRARLRDEHMLTSALAGRPSVELVSSGRAVQGVDLKVVDDAGRVLPPDVVGRVLVRSSFLLRGYFRREDLNGSLVDADGFFDTGDLGALDADGHLTVTGRRKDIIIVAGKNVYPQDVEQVADSVGGIRPGRAVAFGVHLTARGTDGIVVVAESDADLGTWPTLARELRVAVASALDLELLDVRIVPRQTLRKSTSGKLARSGNCAWYLQGRFGPLPSAVRPDDDDVTLAPMPTTDATSEHDEVPVDASADGPAVTGVSGA